MHATFMQAYYLSRNLQQLATYGHACFDVHDGGSDNDENSENEGNGGSRTLILQLR